MLFTEPLQGLLFQKIKCPVVYYEMKCANFTELPSPSPWDDGNFQATLYIGENSGLQYETFPSISHIASFKITWYPPN